MISGDIDPKKVEAYRVAAKPSGTWWIIGKEKSNESTPVASSLNAGRPPPKRRQTADQKPLPPTPTRRATMADVPATPKRRGSVMSVSSVSTTPPKLDVTPNQTPGGSKFFFLTSFTCDVRHADPFPSLLFFSCHHRPERADVAPERRYRSRLLDHRASKGHDHSERRLDHRRFSPRYPGPRRWCRRSVPRLSRCPSCRRYCRRSGQLFEVHSGWRFSETTDDRWWRRYD